MYPKFDCAIIVQLLCNYAGRDSKLHNAKIVGMERIETWEYPIDAIREGITNKMNVLVQKWCKNDAKTFIRKDDEMVGSELLKR